MEANQNKVRVEIDYTDELKIIVDSCEMEDIDAIRGKEISQWFKPSNDAYGWRGLLEEIKEFLSDNDIDPKFEFRGQDKDRRVFNEILKAYGHNLDDGYTDEEIVSDSIEKAQQAHARGLYNDELNYYVEKYILPRIHRARRDSMLVHIGL